MTKLIKHSFIALLTSIMMAALAASMFAVSYESLTSLALSHGVSGAVVWLWPLGLDGLIILTNIVRMRSSLEGEKNIKAMVVMGFATVMSVLLNVVHAPAGDYIGMVLFAIPPLVLWISSEITADLLRDIAIQRSELERKVKAQLKAEARKAANV